MDMDKTKNDWEWVIEGQLARGGRPGRRECGESVVPQSIVGEWTDELWEAGIRSVICLLDDEQLTRYYPDLDLLACYQAQGMESCRIPTRDFQDPPLSMRDLERIWRAWLQLPKPVLIHCCAGVSRTGRAVSFIKGRLIPVETSRARK